MPPKWEWIVALAFALAACRGNGSSPPSPAPQAAPSAAPSSTSTGGSSTGSTSATSGGTSTAPAPFGPSGSATGNTITLNVVQESIPPFGGPSSNSSFTYQTDSSGNITSVTIPSSVAGKTVTLTPSALTPPFPGGQEFFGEDPGLEPTSLESMGKSTGLSFSDFGQWNNRAGNHFYAGGVPTPPAQLPPAGANITATYNGTYLEAHDAGTFAGNPLASGSDSGGMSVTANFGSRQVSADFTSGILQSSGTANTGSNTISPSGTYSAFASNFSTFAPIQIRMNGGFFGSSTPAQAPPETGGTFTGTIGTAGMSGSYGAHR